MTIRAHTQPPARVRSNVAVPAIPVGRQTMFFFPDRILVFDRRRVGAVGYDALNTEVVQVRFIESEGVPPDGKVVDQTWRYMNKKDGPDRPFKDNRELPIALYEELQFTSASGLKEIIQVSQLGVAEKFKTAAQGLRLSTSDVSTSSVASSGSGFVVKAREAGSQSNILVFVNDTTYEAYNFWGGRSVYGFRSLCTPVWAAPGAAVPPLMPWGFRVSFRRPFIGVWPQGGNKWTYWEEPLARTWQRCAASAA
jgi:hypothetical protein